MTASIPSVRSRAEILHAANEVRHVATSGEALQDTEPVITQPQCMRVVAEALDWAAGKDNSFAEMLKSLALVDAQEAIAKGRVS